MSDFILTIDTDWAPDFVLEDTFALIREYQINCTVFATHNTRILTSLHNEKLFEVGLHPNITDINGASETLENVAQWFPQSVSLRSHSLTHSSRFFPIYQKLGIRYTSNYLAFLNSNIQPIQQPMGIQELPVYFMDDAYLLMYNANNKFSITSLGLHMAGMKIFAFHPIHIYLNSHSLENYDKEKKNEGSTLQNMHEHNKHNKGIRSLFKEFLAYLAENEHVQCLRDVSSTSSMP